MKQVRFLMIPLISILLLSGSAFAAASHDHARQAQTRQSAQAQAPYTWKSVQIVGGGFVDGVIFHPSEPGVRYARTDMGGAYRWDEGAKRWQPILDWMPYKDLNLMGVESIAVDPADANRVYLACGTYTNAGTPNGAILRSEDRGQSFQRTDVPFKFGGNEDGRGNGERMAVDPSDGRTLYLGTRHAGLWRSQDRGVSWAKVNSFPEITEVVAPWPQHLAGESEDHFWSRIPVVGAGIVFVKFPAPGPNEPRGLASQTIYAGVSLMNRDNLFVSHDGGTTWAAIPGEPTAYRPTRAALSADGSLYVTYGTAPGPMHMKNGAVWKLDTHTGKWTEITPDKPGEGREFGYAAVSVDAHNPKTLIVSSFHRPNESGGEDIFRSTDGGVSWKTIFGAGGQYDYSGAPYVKPTPIHWLFDIEIDPLNPAHAVFTTGYGGWETFDLTNSDQDKPTHWSILATGIEETVALELTSPGVGPHLVSAIGDYGGFVHNDLDKPAPEGASAPPRMGNTNGVVAAALHPEMLVRVGTSAEHKLGQGISYSLDSGKTWAPTTSWPNPNSRGGSISVSADGAAWVWTPERSGPFVSSDRGATWTAVQNLPGDLHVVADPVDAKTFYAFELKTRTLWRSQDGGTSFTAEKLALPEGALAATQRGDERGGQDRVYAAPGRKGDLWLAAWDGLYRAAPGGKKTPEATPFVQLAGVDEIHAFGFGKAAPGRSYPTLYLVGTVHGQPGIFRSTDEARSWLRINDDRHQWGLILQVAGDPRIYGRVYVGMHGRGIFYGDPAGK
jgi:hypothetical protein